MKKIDHALGLFVMVFVLASSAAAQGTLRWTSLIPSGIVNDAALEGNRVFVGEQVGSIRNRDWHVRALDAATGETMWQDRLDFARRFDESTSIAVRGGIVVAAGRVVTAERTFDAFIRAYDARTGSVLWQDQFEFAGLGEFSFQAISIGQDAVFVAGLVGRPSSNVDWLVRAYALTTGALLWQDLYDSGGLFDHPVTLVSHGSRLFAGGVTNDPTTFVRHFTVRAYDSATGTLLWADRAAGGPAVTFALDVAWKLAAEGNRLFAAGSIGDETGTYRWAVRAYDVATGDLRWSRLDDSGSGSDVAFSIEAAGGRLFATGSGGSRCSSVVASDCDVLVRAYDQETGGILWQSQFDGGGHDDQGTVVRVAGRHVLVASAVQSPSETVDCLVQSYDARTGAVEWSDRFTSSGGFAWINQIAAIGARAVATGYQFDASGIQGGFIRAYNIR